MRETSMQVFLSRKRRDKAVTNLHSTFSGLLLNPAKVHAEEDGINIPNKASVIWICNGHRDHYH